MEAKEIFGANVRRARKAAGLSQEHLAFQAGVARSYMSDVERGQRNPTVDIVGRIAAALGVAAAVLVDGIPELMDQRRD
jgi:transcriptional regulator with XRE-family HTH domain